jgi:hypothetical protein
LLPKRKFTHPLIQPAEAGSSKFDEFVKSRHSGENRSPKSGSVQRNGILSHNPASGQKNPVKYTDTPESPKSTKKLRWTTDKALYVMRIT